MTPRAVSTQRLPFATIELSVKCPFSYQTASWEEGVTWVECGCDLTAEIDYSCYLPAGGWRIGRQPEGCPLNHGIPYTDAERGELQRRIVDAYERWESNQETR